MTLGRLSQRLLPLRLDLAGAEPDTLTPETRAALAGLEGEVHFTLLVSAPEAMPSDLKRVEPEARALLRALRRAAPEKVSVRVLDPGTSPDGAAYAASKRVSPVSVRRVGRDEESEQRVWSSLVIGAGRGPEVLLQGLTDAHLPRLQALVARSLAAQARPVRPVFAVAAPPYFRVLRGTLAGWGEVVEADLRGGGRLPMEADVLFWMEPESATPEQVRDLQRFVASGRTAIVAGGTYAVSYREDASGVWFVPRRAGEGFADLARPFGIAASPDLLLDRETATIPWRGRDGQVRPLDAPFHLRVPPMNYNFKRFRFSALGSLSFISASALQVDPRAAREAGWRPEVLVTTTEDASVAPLPEDRFREVPKEARLPVSKQPLMVLLDSQDPWKGNAVFMGSSSPLRDGVLGADQLDRPMFLKSLVDAFAEPQRLVMNRVPRREPPPVPDQGRAARVFWRLFGVFAVPLGLAVLGLRRLAGSFQAGFTPKFDRHTVLGPAAALAALLAAAALWSGDAGPRWDMTEDRVNSLSPLTRAFVERAPGLRAELVVSERSDLPPEFKGVEPAARSVLEGLGVAVATVRPGTLTAEARAALEREGAAPFEVETVEQDRPVRRRVYSALVLEAAGRREVVPRLEPRNLDHLEFLVAAAAERLRTGERPHVAVASDLPRLTPAEQWEYQQRNQVAPAGADVYSSLKELLSRYGYRVTPVDPKKADLPADADLVVWLQPRYSSAKMLEALSRHLASGGAAVVAAQHFNIQQRQYRGTSYEHVYWPQPQYQDLDRWTRRFGVQQIREVLMDRTRSQLDLETQVQRAARKEFDPQRVALPFLIRAVPAGFSPDSVLTRSLSDQLFIWGNRFALDEADLQAQGLKAQVLITTSDRAWAYAWKGGWIPHQALDAETYLPGPQALAVRLEGPFAPVKVSDEEGPGKGVAPAGKPGKPGQLLLLGSSEMFKNPHLFAAGFRHDQLLLNAAALFALGPELAELQARERPARGFPFQGPAEKLLLRLFAVGAGAAAFLIYGAVRAVREARRAGPPPPAQEAAA